jgi:hypothetical protein
MFYNTFKAFQLLEKYERNHKMKFNCIIFYRADIDSSEILDINIENDNDIYIPDGNDYGGINGLIAYGSNNSMKVYCNLVNNIDKMCREQHVTFHPETLLKKHLENNSIIIKRFPYEYSLHKSRHNHNSAYNSYE